MSSSQFSLNQLILAGILGLGTGLVLSKLRISSLLAKCQATKPTPKLKFDPSEEEFKLVLVIRTDLGMTKGKVAAQCSHATLACYKDSMENNEEVLEEWEYNGQPKITLKCDSEEEMVKLQAKARSLGLCAHSIKDAGRTQIPAGSRTVLGVGPGPVSMVNSVTGHLKLY
ncbi:PTH2-domain-containing protein [Conidiobolus coronatus NRRL 28638]|uniref:peptidyl-tRNA hydrolase n=1 Tax=Conidiobolus coronatus (strain ATCC 28846 / CBS 209.66 / NRRL 28638) TaxID=796925 RepID=A0A137P9X3_CONC2|nr:PTH2-domain-containing protein [Conidiobolus coronatus NRRL 28638]|eukprot:KXN71807.1 PTH2-domain-containing protein [Conidiobolus coronatus NRRL 28638]